ncbi:MAG: DUF3365 domain-containing protein [candidate division Zixibacteria bacterium]|nr:DUF3365 domain-containing protein [candidate division Zixibacteria bacterium]MDH3937343.1 DUF3365 domain-containing protein [candidate division Zixibacteria bacterium]MDH4035670.1 DUF3365 domain-containing protein [candidate division Zixibacteria bacterium]
MLTRKMSVKWIVAALALVIPAALILAGPGISSKPQSNDEELAYLLVKLEKQTRAVIAGHYGRMQDGGPDETLEYKEMLIRNRILPAAVADPIFAEIVPKATGGRAWVKMVVPEPRNPNNKGDHVALSMLAELEEGAESVWLNMDGAVYYGEPITTKPGCFTCHGAPAGEPDPYFPQYKKNGWEPGQVVGAVIARVAAQ